ncbi:acid phosphatase [Novosphingobium mangrovi (ex Hu et al. 2023)]|uniref:acid phosphatase n=1 Tax=Novosphingobium mangrovi (ex Hu et al. 2023) TaxID=2930094 RepID=A0ABT0A7T2_9SPHN|nr:phosphatase PAP2 family protein [Novosphingobium mangrovi (ex Hu et al. 2023)]MCJ1959255.1 phosphatase PAP2 family protein [Novosphingobium mangrovi (ex Hu et al. 2023)]
MQSTRTLGIFTGGCLLVLAGCTTTAPSETGYAALPPVTVAEVGVISPEIPLPKGYLELSQLPDSLALLPPPPAAGSAAKAADEAAWEAAKGASSERFALATSDADLNWPAIVSSFEPLVGTSLSDGTKPHTQMLLRRAMADAGLASYKAKNHYQRVRPFAEKGGGSCTPEEEEALRHDGSYPSGHTTAGWMMALVLAELVPSRADAVLQRGYDFGFSRVICRVHWMSDTVGGRVVAAATFARVQSNPVFQAQLAAARREMAAAGL